MQEILYNSNLTLEQQHQKRGALHELDQMILLAQTARKMAEMEQQGIKPVNGPQIGPPIPSKTN